MNIFKGQTLLLTGGTGSFGQHFTATLLAKHSPKRIRIFSRDELKQSLMATRFAAAYKSEQITFLIGDVRDRLRLRRAMEGCDYVIHCAALKQIPIVEKNPFECVKTNILGGQNVIDCSIDTGVTKVVALSSDKACGSVNLYGGTKFVAEKLFVDGNAYVGNRPTRFCAVRYGNVLGSRGSVIPIWKEQMEMGVLLLTDKRMTRFWITLDQAVELVIKAFMLMQGGEIYVPKLPSMKLTDLAQAIAPDCKIELIGIRPGEKLHETLITKDESRYVFNDLTNNVFIVYPPTKVLWQGKTWEYTSGGNDQWLTIEQLREMI